MILIVALSPAWQRTLLFDRFHPGDVNRATRILESASGKGVNIARVATLLGTPVRLLTVAGGSRGRAFRRALDSDGIRAEILPIKGETRLCQTLVSPGLVTELVEEAPALEAPERKRFLARFTAAAAHARMVILSGSVPQGCGDDFFATLIRLSHARKVPVLLDTQRAPLMEAAQAGPYLIKINRSELAAATGQASVTPGAAMLMSRGVGRVIITDGARATTVFCGTKRWTLRPPRIHALNAIGSGDAMMAGLATKLIKGTPLPLAVRFGTLCGAANALTETSGMINLKDVRRLSRA